MSSKIKVLDEVTINQIAAGEVIENASSVIKELVDNSLDAGASKILIEVQGSGRQSIVIQDDGCGMSHDDLLLCLERHATSKIRSQDDLWRLSTMGFRGEALSAISSISHLTILTAAAPNEGLHPGHYLTSSGGKIKSVTNAQSMRGTKITVNDLFFNVPARRKFLKSLNQEAKDILKVVTLHALARPDVAFELIINGTKELSLTGKSSKEERVRALLGREFFSNLQPLQFQNDWLQIEGYICKPGFTRPTRSQQYLFINGRAVVSSFFSLCMKEAYGTSIEESRHPVFVLFVDIAKDRVDVNVHPQKKEVRFSFEEELKIALLQHVSKVLFQRAKSEVFQPIQQHTYEAPVHYSFPAMPIEEKPKAPELFEEKPHVVGIYDEYILISSHKLVSEGLCFIDSRYAMSRISFEKWQNSQKTVSSQTLLVPLFIECSLEDAESLKIALPHLQDIGLAIREFGTNAFLIEAVPGFLEHIDLEQFLHHVACSVDQRVAVTEKLDALYREAFRFQKKLSTMSVELATGIVKQLFACSDPFTCPLGNKTMFVLTPEEIRKRL